jgi:hypothetical protein
MPCVGRARPIGIGKPRRIAVRTGSSHRGQRGALTATTVVSRLTNIGWGA